MKYAIYLPTFTPYDRPHTIAAVARDAEQAGWDGLFLWDDITWDAELTDPWIALTAAAAATEKMRLGVLVTPISRRRPWKVARETASLDHFSGGRLVFGVGVGSGPEQYDYLGEQPDQRLRGEMTDEALEILTGLWSGEEFHYQGQHYQIGPARFRPPPLQQPRIPIWVAGFWPHKRPLRRMARWDGMFPLFFPRADHNIQQERLRQTVAEVLALRQSCCPDAQQRHFDIIAAGETAGASLQEDVDITAAYAAAGATWWLEWLAPERGGRSWSFEELMERIHAGPPVT